MRNEVAYEIVQEIIKILGTTIDDLLQDRQKLTEWFMGYIFLNEPGINREPIHIGMWRELRNTPAMAYWFRICAKQYGLEWAYEMLGPTYDEKTTIMAEVLGGK